MGANKAWPVYFLACRGPAALKVMPRWFVLWPVLFWPTGLGLRLPHQIIGGVACLATLIIESSKVK